MSAVGDRALVVFTVDVKVPRYKPSLTPLNLVVNEDQGPHTLVFAKDLKSGVPGSPMDSVLRCSWNITHTPTNVVFRSPTVLRTRLVGDKLLGTITFDPPQNFNGIIVVTAYLTDGSEPDPELRTSLPSNFTITVNPVNDPPTVSWCGSNSPLSVGDVPVCNRVGSSSEVLLKQDAGPVALEGLITDITVGPPDEVGAGLVCNASSVACHYKFEVISVDRSAPPADGGGPATGQPGQVSVEVALNGTLFLHVGPRLFGTWKVALKVSDDGGVALGGSNTSTLYFFITVVQVNHPPEISVRDPPPGQDTEVSSPPPQNASDTSIDDGSSSVGNQTASSLPLADLSLIVLEVPSRAMSWYPAYFVLSPYDSAAWHVEAVTLSTSNDWLFTRNADGECSGCPTINVAGDLMFELEPQQYGVSSVEFELTSTSRLGIFDGSTVSSTFSFDIVVLPINNPPSAKIPPSLGIAGEGGYHEIAAFATNVSVGPPNEGWQTPIFAVQVDSDSPGMFLVPPAILPDGTMTYTLAPEGHGTATLTIMLTDDGGTSFGGADEAVGFPVTVDFRSYPMPGITSVSPCIGYMLPGLVVTVRGRHFGSANSRGFVSDSFSEGIRVSVGGQQCSSTSLLSDSEVVCVTAGGTGRGPLSVSVNGGVTLNALGQNVTTWTRESVYVPGVVHAQVLYAGWSSNTTAGSTGFLAFGPTSDQEAPSDDDGTGPTLDVNGTNATNATTNATGRRADQNGDLGDADVGDRTNTTVPATIEVARAWLTRVVRSLVAHGGRIYVGGSFLDETDARFHHLVAWDGNSLSQVGGGIDGDVYSLGIYQEKVVVAGAFSRVYAERGSSLETGGLAMWDGSEWSKIGNGKVEGSCTCVAAAEGTLFVAGKFVKVGAAQVSNIAQFSGGIWSPLGSGIEGRDVMDMVASNGKLYVSGLIDSAGGTPVSNIAMWDMAKQKWYPLGGFNGAIRAVAVGGGRVFAGGDFTVAGYTPISMIAVMPEGGGDWGPVGGGVSGHVHAARVIDGCLYVGGEFSQASDTGSVLLSTNNVARRCLSSDHGSERWEAVKGLPGGASKVVVIAAAQEGA